MTGIDTNVLVRYLVKDEADQARKATQFIRNQCSGEDPGLINRIVLCELVWVLETAYEYPRQSVALVLENILRTAEFIIEDHQEAWLAFREYQEGGILLMRSLVQSINGLAVQSRSRLIEKLAVVRALEFCRGSDQNSA